MTLLPKARSPVLWRRWFWFNRERWRAKEEAICSLASFWQRLALKLHMADSRFVVELEKTNPVSEANATLASFDGARYGSVRGGG